MKEHPNFNDEELFVFFEGVLSFFFVVFFVFPLMILYIVLVLIIAVIFDIKNILWNHLTKRAN